MQIADCRLKRHARRPHARDIGKPIALAQIAAGASRDDIFPSGRSALGARDDVIECEIVARPAILAGETVAQKNVEPREGGMTRWLDIGFQRNDRWQPHFEARTSNRLVVLGHNVHAVEEDSFNRILPGP